MPLLRPARRLRWRAGGRGLLAGRKRLLHGPARTSLNGPVSDLQAFIEELGVEGPIVPGWSYATAVAIEYAKRHPVAGVVLTRGGDQRLTPSWEKPVLRLALALRLYRLPTDEMLVRHLAHRVGFHDETPGALVEDFLHASPMPTRRSAWSMIRDAFWGYDGRGDIDRIEAPALVLHGPADGVVPADVARSTARKLPNGTYQEVPRAGHVAPAERPTVYNDALREFVRRVS